MHAYFCSAAVRCSPRVSTCFHVLLLPVVFCISSTSLRNMTSLVFLPNREWFVVYVGAQNITWWQRWSFRFVRLGSFGFAAHHFVGGSPYSHGFVCHFRICSRIDTPVASYYSHVHTLKYRSALPEIEGSNRPNIPPACTQIEHPCLLKSIPCARCSPIPKNISPPEVLQGLNTEFFSGKEIFFKQSTVKCE